MACGAAGCDTRAQLVPDWELHRPNGAPVQVQLPANLERHVPRERSVYSLRARVTIPPPWRNRELALIVPALDGLIDCRADGHETTPSVLEAPKGYRQPGPHRFGVPSAATTDGQIDLELIVRHEWTGSANFGAAPRLVGNGEADSLTWTLWVFNLILAIGAVAALFQVATTSTTVYFTDRRRYPYLLFGLHTLAAMIYPLHWLGVTQVLFGRGDAIALATLLLVAMCVSLYFTNAFFGLPPPSHWFVVGAIVADIPIILTTDQFQSRHYLGVILYLIVCASYQVVTCMRLLFAGKDRQSARYQLLAWTGLTVVVFPDFIAWSGFADPLHGIRVGNVGLGMFSFTLSLLFSQRHITSMADSDRKGAELEQRIGELERNRVEIEALNSELKRQLSSRSAQIFSALTFSNEAKDAPRLTVGEIVNEHYRVEKPLGSGGMGEVFEVTRLHDNRRYALKLTREATGLALARLAREAQVALTVSHPNVVQVVDVDIASAGFLFIVMELVEGRSLRQHMNEPSARTSSMEWKTNVLTQIAQGLLALHEACVVHRDLHPANVLLTQDANGVLLAKITDFGISLGTRGLPVPESLELPPRESSIETSIQRIGSSDCIDEEATITKPDIPAPSVVSSTTNLRSGEQATAVIAGRSHHTPLSNTPLTQTGFLAGTPAYIAPELVRGRVHISPAVDVFAFGVMAYELLTGRSPFFEPPFTALIARREVLWPKPMEMTDPTIPSRLRGLIDQCLAPLPQDRPDAKAILEACANGAA